MTHLLLVYRRSTGRLLDSEDLGQDGARATQRRFERELIEKDDPDVEVVVLSGSSTDAMRRTHARYFKQLDQLANDMEQALPR